MRDVQEPPLWQVLLVWILVLGGTVLAGGFCLSTF
jgi:hypothetical protein